MGYADPEVQREYQRRWRAARRSAWLTENGPCVDCGSREDLEVDHVDPAEKIDHKVWSWSDERRVAELAKCVVRCHDCHLERTLAMRRPAEHGSAQMYQAHKCRCPECRAWKRDSDRKYRSRKAA